MSFTHPKFGLVSPSESTEFRKLGQELRELGASIEGILEGFDYNGADPNAVIAQVNALQVAVNAHTATLTKRPAAASGVNTHTTAGGATSTNSPVTFPPGRFTRPPIVVLQHMTPASLAAVTEIRPSAVTKDGFNVQSYKTTSGTGSVTINWIAVEA